MAFDLHITISEDSPRWHAIQQVVESQQMTPEQAAEKVFDDGVKAQLPRHPVGNIWGLGSEDSDILDEIVASAMVERRNRFSRRLDA